MKNISEANSNRISRSGALLIMVSVVLGMLILCVPLFMQETFAADTRIATMNGESYWNYHSLVDDLEDKDGETVTIEMLRDWDCNQDDRFNKPLNVPKKCNLTINMHGHLFRRKPSAFTWGYDVNGEIIYVYPGATLTINGASNEDEKQTSHSGIKVFTNLDQDEPGGTETIKGACLTGGNSTAGTGGIYIDAGKDITLNDVTIAGCMAKEHVWNNAGYGGGIVISESGTKLVMNNSTITGCLAQNYGGGIYAQNDNDVKIELNNSHIDKNYAKKGGGGVNIDGEDVSVSGKNKSSISNNKSEGYGGGVYFWNDDVDLTAEEKGDLEISDNSAKQGGGVYLNEEDNDLKNLTIKGNYSSDLGGGIYCDNDVVTIDSCEITSNDKYGVYLTKDCDEGMVISGSTAIKDNKSGNLTLQNGSDHVNFEPNEDMDVYLGYVDKPDSNGYTISQNVGLDCSSHVTSDLSGYEVVYNYRDRKDDDGRRLRFVKTSDKITGDRHREEPEIVSVRTQDIHAYDAGKVYAGGYTSGEGGSGTRYQLRSIYAHHTLSGDKDFQTYYTDGFFFDDPVIYNDHLATASYALASTGAYLDSYKNYEYKHIGARQFMADIGCPDQMIYVNDSNSRKPGTDTIGVTIGSKTLQEYDGNTNKLVDTENVLIAVGIRSANYGNEWASNVTLGDGSKSDGEAQGFSEAADQTMQAVDYYITRYGLQDEIHQGRVKFWIAGFSRGGATANLTAKRLIEKYCVQTGDPSITVETGNEVFAYTLEAPKGGTDKGEHLNDKTQYYRIHNLTNTGDLVTYVGPAEMGFKRYGVDHYMPGTYFGRKTKQDYLDLIKIKELTPKGASQVSGVTKVTTYADNAYLDTKKDMDSKETDSYKAYVNRRDQMVLHLATIDHTTLYSDYFYPYGTGLDLPPYTKQGDFDGAKVEDYLPNLFAFLQKEAMKRFDDADHYRENYAVNKVKIGSDSYDTIQDLARDYLSAEGEKGEKFTDLKKAFGIVFSSKWNLINLPRQISNYYMYRDSAKKELIQDFWDDADEEGAFNDLSSEEKEVLHRYWFTMAEPALNFANGDWSLGQNGQGWPVYPTETKWVNGSVGGGAIDVWATDRVIYALTMVENVDMIINMNHSRAVGIAWARTYDSYYTSDPQTGEMNYENEEFKANWVDPDRKPEEFNPDHYTVDVPKAYVKRSEPNSTETYKQLRETKANEGQKFNTVNGGQKIILEVGEIYDDVSPVGKTQGAGGDVLGEAIFYEITDITDEAHPKPLLRNNLYGGGVDLPRRADGGKYKIVTYAISLGKMSEKTTYYISVGHKVTIDNGSGGEPVTTYYPSGELAAVSAAPADDKFFKNWTVELLDESGTTVQEDIADIVLGDKKADITASFAMPESGSTYAPGETYPDGYALEITAVCKDRIGRITVSTPDHELVPVGGKDLPETTNIEVKAGSREWVPTDDNNVPIAYPVSWTYSYQKGEETIVVPASGEAFRKTDYTATIVVPQDRVKDIMFLPTGENLSAVYGGAEAVKGVSVTRNDADGSATVVIEFNQTGDSGPLPPESTIMLEVNAFDLNLNGDLPDEGVTYHVLQEQQLVIVAPAVADEKFYAWDFGKSGVVLAEGYNITDKIVGVIIPTELETTNLSIAAQYIPVISKITAKLDAPAGGNTMQTKARGTTPDTDATLKVTISGEYEIDPEFVNIDWSPAPLDGNKADYLKNYTATIRLAPKKDGQDNYYIMAKGPNDAKYKKTAAIFLYSEGLEATINGKAATVDMANNSISYTFPVTTYKIEKVYPPEDVTGIPYGTSEDELASYLPLIKIELDDGSIMDAAANWGPLHKEESGDKYSMQTWTSDGEVQLPYGVSNPDPGKIDLSVSGKLIVDAAKGVEKAVPSADPGEYFENLSLTLVSGTDGADIYWTTDPQATDDLDQIRTEGSGWHKYDGLMIELKREDATEDEIGPDGDPTGRKMIRLRTAAFRDGMRPDGPRAYVYVFDNKIKIPEGRDSEYNGSPQIGVFGREYYTLESISQGVSINDAGDAMATEPGTYQVKAKIKDDFIWEITDPETGEATYTTDDQTVTFNIVKSEPEPPVDPGNKDAIEIYDPTLPKVSMKTPSRGKGSVKARWKKLSKKKRKKITGIEIQYARNKKFTKDVGVVKTGKGKTSKKIKKLARKKTYYVRARTIREVDNVKYYGKWSGRKKIKTR